MTEKQIQVLDKYFSAKISRETFLQEFGKGAEDLEFIKRTVRQAIKSQAEEKIERAINLMWFYQAPQEFIAELNILLLVPNHKSHQVITNKIQHLGNPQSIPFLKKALESNFDYLAYTGSESGAIAKWFSWALFSIGTEEAIDLIKEYSKSDDEGIRNEMRYRLSKLPK